MVLIFNKCQSNLMRRKINFAINSAKITEYPYGKKIISIPISYHTLINSRWIIVLNIKTKSIKLPEENIGHPYDLGVGKGFLEVTECNNYKKKKPILKTSVHLKISLRKRTRKLQTGRNYLQNLYITKGQYLRYIKNSLQLYGQKYE